MVLTEKFRAGWKDAGYTRGCGSMRAAPPPANGLKRLYYLTGPDHAVSNIVFGRIKLSRFADLNDPFELLGTNFGHKETRAAVRTYKTKINDTFGLICFSEDWVDPVLWSHYAAKHRGVALGFDVDETIVKRVTYQTERLDKKIPTGATAVTKSIAELLTYTKFESWKYEREWRILSLLDKGEIEGSIYFLPFGRRLHLMEVILGPTCDFSISKMRDLVDHHHDGVTTFQARLADRSFRIIAKGRTVPLPR
jgi:Protein of unknown function (DUF2971)